jgi:hypothetical protein
MERLARLYGSSVKKIKKIKYDPDLYLKLRTSKEHHFHFEDLDQRKVNFQPLPDHFKIKQAYHQLIIELVSTQVKSIKSIIKKTDIRTIYIEGEFIKNLLYVKMIAHQLEEFRIYTSEAPAGPAFGAAIALHPESWSKKLFKKFYGLQRVK